MKIHPNLASLLSQLEEIKQESQKILDGLKHYTELSKAHNDKITSVCGKIDSFLGSQEPEEAPQDKNPCTHPHWEETPATHLIIKTCLTCGVQKYE